MLTLFGGCLFLMAAMGSEACHPVCQPWMHYYGYSSLLRPPQIVRCPPGANSKLCQLKLWDIYKLESV